jgi:hypothetical protein
MNRLALSALCLACSAHAQTTQTRFTVLQPDASLTWHGDIYGPQHGAYDVIYNASDNDTIAIDSFETITDGTWYLEAWYMPDGYCAPTGCASVYAWTCPAWSTDAAVVVNCRILPDGIFADSFE